MLFFFFFVVKNDIFKQNFNCVTLRYGKGTGDRASCRIIIQGTLPVLVDASVQFDPKSCEP